MTKPIPKSKLPEGWRVRRGIITQSYWDKPIRFVYEYLWRQRKPKRKKQWTSSATINVGKDSDGFFVSGIKVIKSVSNPSGLLKPYGRDISTWKFDEIHKRASTYPQANYIALKIMRDISRGKCD